MKARDALCLAFVAMASCAEPDEGYPGFEQALDSILATVATNSGELTVKHSAQGVWEPANTALPLYPGDWLRTGKGASAHVEFLAGGALDIEEEAVVVIEALKPLEKTHPDTPDSAPLVAVQSGSIRSSLSDKAGKERPLLVRTADGTETRVARKAGTGPADLRVASVQGETEVSVAQGEVELESGGKAEVVETGSAAAVGKKGVRRLAMPRRPSARAPAADARLKAGEIVVSWQGAGETAFRLQVAKDSTFRTLERNEDQSGEEARFDASLGAHFWRVAARDADGRIGPWSTPRRFFAEKELPTDSLLEPAPGASFGYADAPPRIALKWAPRAGARAYKVVVSKSADLSGTAVVSESTGETELRVDALVPGEYFWGVWVQSGALEPLFLAPRKLTVKKVSGARVVAPQRIKKWGP